MSSAHIVLMAYLDRAVNGDGYVDREYGVGRGRIDLLLRWSNALPDGTSALQREAIELKVHRPDGGDPTGEGLRQLDGYLDRLGLSTGYLVVFDQRPGAVAPPSDAALNVAISPAGRNIALLHC